ncbi:MAG: hypothetical protein JSW26_00140 [Desulfobacterales bacterium]|nr:MAG: hypothetical protein JSW26_00140 [Desulfobacterales bacterium]
MKLRKVGPVNGLNVEHRTLNIEPPIWMGLRFIYFKKSEQKLATCCAESDFDWSIRPHRAGAPAAPALARRVRSVFFSIFFIDEIPYSMLDVGRSMFDVH